MIEIHINNMILWSDFTELVKLCQIIKEKGPYDTSETEEYIPKEGCPCDRKTWRGRKYIGRVSSLDGRVTSSSSDGRLWTIVSKGLINYIIVSKSFILSGGRSAE